jgi:Putative GTPase activating protein for Arf
MPTLAEDRVKQLAKLKTNTVCPNCGYEKKFGFGTVCIKFLTFVCNECKSSHQAISHRCKSLTMSSWTNDEVEALARGGNLMARRTWLKHAPPEGTGGRPSHGMDINVYKRFIVQTYEERRYYGELDPNDGMVQTPTAAKPSAVAPQKATTMPIVSPRRTTAPAPAAAQTRMQIRQPIVHPGQAPVAAPIVADLLDFSAPAPALASTTAGNGNLFGADFATAFQASPAPAPAALFDAFGMAPVPASAPVAKDITDPFAFGAFNDTTTPAVMAPAAPPPPPPSSSRSLSSSDPFQFGDFGSSLPTASSSLNNNMSSVTPSSDLFGGAKKPIMGGPSAVGSASAISLMGSGRSTGMAMPPSMGGGGGGMGNPMMMNSTHMGMYNNPGMMGMGGTGMDMNMNMMNPQMMAMMQNQMMMMHQGNFMMNSGPQTNPMGGSPGNNAMAVNMNVNMNPTMMQEQQRKYQQMMNQNKF